MISKAVAMESCKRIVIFTDSLAMARRVVDPSVHSGQQHSLAACKDLQACLSVHKEHRIDFIETPSKLKWGLQHRAHRHACSLPPVPTGPRPQTLLDYIRKGMTDSALDAWATLAQDQEYPRSQFMILRDPKGKPVRPMYSNGGTWLKHVNDDNALLKQMTSTP